MEDAHGVLSNALAVVAHERDHQAQTARLRRVVDESFDFVWRVLRRMGVPSRDADDAAQQCFLVVARRLKEIEEGRERAFLFQTAIRVARNEHRSARRRREDGEQKLSAIVDPAGGPEDIIEQKWARRTLDALLATMPDEQRAAFVLFELEGLTLRETADVLGVPQGTAASRVRKARQHYDRRVRRLRERIGNGGSR